MKKIACHYLVIERQRLPYSPCVVVFDTETKVVQRYYPFTEEESFTEWRGGELTVEGGILLGEA